MIFVNEKFAMSKTGTKEWYRDWFNSPFYHRLYFERDEKEAKACIHKLIHFLQPQPGSRMLDVACGRGRHSRMLAEMGFDLTGFDLTQIRIVGKWAVDNTGTDILVNGVTTAITSPGFDGFTPFIINSGLNAGPNQLDFKMNNAAPDVNPTGLRVDLELQQTIQPTLTLTATGGGTGTVSWTPSSPCQTLYSADSVTGPWTPIQTFNGSYSFDTGTVQFFKVVEQ